MSDIGENKHALMCRTNAPGCCKAGATGEFFYPSGVAVSIMKFGHKLYRDRGEGVVRLNRRIIPGFEESMPPPLGTYSCRVPDACGREQRVFINLK